MDFLEALSYLLINIILPISIISVIVLLFTLFRQLLILVNNITIISKDIEHKLELLEGPVNSINSINNKYLNLITTFNVALLAYKGIFKIKKNRKK